VNKKKAVEQDGQKMKGVFMSNQSIPEKAILANPLRVAAGGLLGSGTGFGAYAAACMDGGAGVDVIGALVLSGLGLALAGGALLYAAQKIEEARADRELADEIRRLSE